MKKIITLSSIVVAVGVLTILIHACNKKQESQTATPAAFTQPQEIIQRNKALIAAKIHQDGIPITVIVNERLKPEWADTSGRVFSQSEFRQMLGTLHNGTTVDYTSACDGSNTPSVTLLSYSVANDCSQGYKVSWTFQLSSNNVVVPSNGPSISKGFLRVYSSTSPTTLLFSQNVTPADVTDVGPDGTIMGNELFNVKFTSGWVPNADPYISAVGTSNVKLGGFFTTDCFDFESFSAGIQAYSATNFSFPSGQPCTRIDPIWINPGSGTTLTILGEDPIGNCSGISGYTYPIWQEVQYSDDNGATWNTTHLSYSFMTCPYNLYTGKQYVDPIGFGLLTYDYSYLSTGTHTILFRSRDIYFNTSDPANTPHCSATPAVPYPLPPSATGTCYGNWSASQSFVVTR